VNERRPEEDRSWSTNPDTLPPSSVLLTTTDLRTPKAQQQILSSEASPPQRGAPFELAWWFTGTGEQFRFLGTARLWHPSLASSSSPSSSSPLPSHLAPSDTFDWESERKRIFRKLSPQLRSTFIRPVPGTPLNECGVDLSRLPEEMGDDMEEDPVVKRAFENFALVVLEVEGADWLNLKKVPNEREQWRRGCSDGEWRQWSVVP
jgi:pyridoxamine 5'-phosphate oxidase